MVSETLGARIRRLRNEAGMSQVQLGMALGVGNQMVSQWERGVRRPAPENQERLAEALGVSHAELAYGRRLEGDGAGIPSAVAHVYNQLTDRDRRVWLRIGHVLREEQEAPAAGSVNPSNEPEPPTAKELRVLDEEELEARPPSPIHYGSDPEEPPFPEEQPRVDKVATDIREPPPASGPEDEDLDR